MTPDKCAQCGNDKSFAFTGVHLSATRNSGGRRWNQYNWRCHKCNFINTVEGLGAPVAVILGLMTWLVK